MKKGETIHGFKLKRTQKLKELRSVFYELKHLKTDARYIHLANKDQENTFCVGFKTVPTDSTGVAHILEHSVLAGSRQYPVRDPFFSMLKRSLNTFMNAFTSNDWTAYPFSTQNKKDFYNLLSVYLDAAFYPKISKATFAQEGWRLEFENDKLVYKGIVYNEMKGVMSSPQRVAEESIGKALFPGATYRHNSGGSPEEIPSLAYNDFKNFHKRFYHPSNAYFYTYGNFSLEKHLEYIDNNFLKNFSKTKPDSKVKIEANWEKEKRLAFEFPLAPDENPKKKFQASVAWRLVKAEDSFELLALEVLEDILVGNPSSLLRKALIESGLGSGLSDASGLIEEFRSAVFSCGLKDIGKQDISRVKKIIINTLKQLAQNGIPEKLIDSAIHKIEFNHKEITNSPYPHGLHINLDIFNAWIHGGDPLRVLDFEADMKRLKKLAKEEGFLEKLIQKYFLGNKNRVLLILEPDKQKLGREARAEAKKLKLIQNKLSQKEKEKIKKDSESLAAAQTEAEDLSCLPTLEIKEIPAKIIKAPAYSLKSKSSLGDKIKKFYQSQEIIYYNQPTHDIFYLRFAFEIKSLAKNLYNLVPLFCYLIPRIGTKKHSYTELSEIINLYTGGIKLSAHTHTRIKSRKHEEFVLFDAKCLNRNREKMFEIIFELTHEFSFADLKTLKNFILEYLTKLEAKIVEDGHLFAMLLASRKFSTVQEQKEKWRGISQLLFLKKLVKNLDDKKLLKIAKDLNKIGQTIFQAKPKIAIISDKTQDKKSCLRQGFGGQARKASPLNLKIASKEMPATREAWHTSTSVSFVACAFPIINISHPDSPIIFIISKLLRNKFLHREIREKGGAYGAYARYDYEEGIFYLASYRDPNIAPTLDAYTRSMEFLQSGDYADEDIKEAILQCCSALDKPESPAREAKEAFELDLIGLDNETRLNFKHKILKTKKVKVVKIAKKYFNRKWEDCSVAVITGEEQLKEANREMSKKLRVFEIRG